MPKRQHHTTAVGTRRPIGDSRTAASADDGLHQRVVAFAEQLGAMVGSVHAKAEGWLDRESLTAQVAAVRDAAADLLGHLAGPATAVAPVSAVPERPARAAAGRSGGRVDAPGKKHRPPLAADHASNVTRAQAAQLRAARPMAKTNRRRGRG